MLIGTRVGRVAASHGEWGFTPLRGLSPLSCSPRRPYHSLLRHRPQKQHLQYSTSTTRQQRQTSDFQSQGPDSNVVNEQSLLLAEANARQARLQYGGSLPHGFLSKEEYTIYERLYGPPVSMLNEEEKSKIDRVDKDASSMAVVEGEQAVGREALNSSEDPSIFEDAKSPTEEYDMEDWEEYEDDDAGRLLERQRAEEAYDAMEDEQGNSTPRTHFLTAEGRFADSPRVISLPGDAIQQPVMDTVGQLSNKHITEMAYKTFGSWLQDSVATLSKPGNRHIQQKAPPLTAAQSTMSPTEAAVFMVCNMPGMYASALTTLVETRKRLGSTWLERLFLKQGGPRVLDVGSAGACALAWREVLRAEWERTRSSSEPFEGSSAQGRATVVVGAQDLSERVSRLFTNTTFLPRLPDFERARDIPGWERYDPSARKKYDVIIASHSLWPLGEDYERRDQLQNLWTLLNPEGGVLIVIEKGVPRGFELIGAARSLLLDSHIAAPAAPEDLGSDNANSQQTNQTQKEKGMIIAPCTNHGTCPMYSIPGEMQGRKDYCRFATRFVRPAYLKRILGPRARDQERIRFSYIAVQRGADLRETQAIQQDESATRLAHAGYEWVQPAATTPAAPHMLSLPRLIMPPLKAHGHVTLDMCTPAATIERWIVPRSKSKQAYRDARKAQWGDLWSLGAKTRTVRDVRTGVPKRRGVGKGKGKKMGKGRRGSHGDAEAAMVWPE